MTIERRCIIAAVPTDNPYSPPSTDEALPEALSVNTRTVAAWCCAPLGVHAVSTLLIEMEWRALQGAEGLELLAMALLHLAAIILLVATMVPLLRRQAPGRVTRWIGGAGLLVATAAPGALIVSAATSARAAPLLFPILAGLALVIGALCVLAGRRAEGWDRWVYLLGAFAWLAAIYPVAGDALWDWSIVVLFAAADVSLCALTAWAMLRLRRIGSNGGQAQGHRGGHPR